MWTANVHFALVVKTRFLDFFSHAAGVTQRGLLLFTELSPKCGRLMCILRWL